MTAHPAGRRVGIEAVGLMTGLHRLSHGRVLRDVQEDHKELGVPMVLSHQRPLALVHSEIHEV
jgi:hypothetical protein